MDTQVEKKKQWLVEDTMDNMEKDHSGAIGHFSLVIYNS